MQMCAYRLGELNGWWRSWMKNERWFKKHSNVHFHFAPARSSWLNRVETWFSVLQGQSLTGVALNATALPGAEACVSESPPPLVQSA
jgi:hypothetical protein